jgi:hypothetical protein
VLIEPDAQQCRHSSGPDGQTEHNFTFTNANGLARRAVGAQASGPLSPVDPAVDAEFDPDMVRAPKRLRRIAVRNASLLTAAVALCSRRQGNAS